MSQKSKLPFKAQPGDIILTRESDVMSWFLRILEGPFPYSHACLVGEEVNGQPTIYTAAHKTDHDSALTLGFFRHVDAYSYLRDRSYVVCRVKGGLGKEHQEEIVSWCKNQLGEEYPVRKVLKYLKDGFKGLGITEVIHEELFDREHCFESVAKAYETAGIKLNERAGNQHASGYDGKEIYLSPMLVDIYAKAI